jgi:hypothetical protein
VLLLMALAMLNAQVGGVLRQSEEEAAELESGEVRGFWYRSRSRSSLALALSAPPSSPRKRESAPAISPRSSASSPP